MDEIVTENQCKRCGGVRDWGKRGRCKLCQSVYNQKYGASHPSTLRENKENKRIRSKIYRQAHKREYAEHQLTRKHRIKGNVGSFTVHEWRALCERYDHKCLACGSDGALTVDHVIPVIHGGTSFIENIQPLCRSCNSKKGTLTIDYR